MRTRKFATALASIGVAAALTLGIAGVALADGERKLHSKPVAICDYRICFELVDLLNDTDGDGYSDIDELWAGTDPKDPKSHPLPELLTEGFLKNELPSFNNHLTEVVVLPVLTPKGDALASVLGRVGLPLPARRATTIDSMLANLKKMGFDPADILGSLTAKNSGVFGNLGQLPWSGAGGLGTLHIPGQGLYNLGGTGMGSGGGATGSKITKWQENKDGSADFSGKTTYPDGSSSSFYGGREPTGTYFPKDDGGTNGGGSFQQDGNKYRFVIEYKDSKGRKVKEEIIELNTDKSGKVKGGKVIEVTYDPETGEKTGSKESKCVSDCPAPPSQNGQTETKTETKTTDPKETKDAGESPKESAAPNSMCDPDADGCYGNSVTFPLTREQEKALMLRLSGGIYTNPVPDYAEPFVVPEDFDPNADPDAPIKYVTDEGYGVVRITGEPHIGYNHAGPDYPQDLQSYFDFGGVPEPCGPGGTACN